VVAEPVIAVGLSGGILLEGMMERSIPDTVGGIYFGMFIMECNPRCSSLPQVIIDKRFQSLHILIATGDKTVIVSAGDLKEALWF
jgi:hypothetical protein